MRGELATSLATGIENYVVVDRDGRFPTGAPTPIGDGGSSVVYRAVYRGRLHRAVKVIIPRDELRATIDLGLFANNFETEVALLSGLSHENIAKIVDFGTVRQGDEDYAYIITDFIDGEPIDAFCRAESTTGEQILAVLEQVLSATAYLHANKVLHSDIKPANILVKPPPHAGAAPTAVLIDLGVSHVIAPSEDASDHTYVFTTKRIATNSLRPLVNNSSTPRIRRDELMKEFPWLDLHAFGLVLHGLLEDETVAAKLRTYLGVTNMPALADVRRRLDNPRLGGKHFPSALAVREALNRLPFHRISPLGRSELAPVPEKGVVLPTSRARVPSSGRIDAVISHPLFQRLHNLPQLDLLHFVLPGATHTRFVHALHTYDLARTAICHQLGDWRFRLNVDVADVDATLFSALLDSVGRYHFQHMFEDFYPKRKAKELSSAGLLDDEDLLDQVMSPDGDDRYTPIRDLRDSHGRRLCDTIESCTGMSWAEVRKRQSAPETPIQGFLAGLLSNPVDVDKLAYLIDDSAFSGLPFGQAVAPGPVFEALRIPDDRHWRDLPGPRIAVAVREKALSYVEQSVLARYWNIQTGYWYRTNRSLQAMVKFLIGSLLKARSLRFHEFVQATLHLSADGALRWLDEQFRAAIQSGAIDENTVNPIEGLLQSRRDIYRRLVTISPRSKLDERSNDRFIYEGLRARSPLDDDAICQQAADVLETVKPGLKVRPGELLLDLQRIRREDIGGKILVYADSPGAALLGELSSISPVLEELEKQFDLYAKRLRIFMHPRLHAELGGLEERAHQATLDMLRAEFPK